MRCDQCDNRLIVGWNFCPYCGRPQTDEEIEAAQRELTARQKQQETIYKLSEQIAAMRCEDCPPDGYPTDATRCRSCPRRTAEYHAGEGISEPLRGGAIMTIKATCTACGGDCSNANATYNGYIYHVGCLPIKKPKSRQRFCWNCGASMGVIQDRYYDRTDTCGKTECEREARNAAYAEREESHEQLDRDMGWLE